MGRLGFPPVCRRLCNNLQVPVVADREGTVDNQVVLSNNYNVQRSTTTHVLLLLLNEAMAVDPLQLLPKTQAVIEMPAKSCFGIIQAYRSTMHDDYCVLYDV